MSSTFTLSNSLKSYPHHQHKETHPLDVAIKTEDVKNALGVDLKGVEAVNHDDWRVGLSGVIGRRAVTVLWAPVARTAACAGQRWPHPPALIVRGRGAVRFVIVTVTALRTAWRKKKKMTSEIE